MNYHFPSVFSDCETISIFVPFWVKNDSIVFLLKNWLFEVFEQIHDLNIACGVTANEHSRVVRVPIHASNGIRVILKSIQTLRIEGIPQFHFPVQRTSQHKTRKRRREVIELTMTHCIDYGLMRRELKSVFFVILKPFSRQ